MSYLIPRCVAMACFTHATRPKHAAAQATFARTILRTSAVETLSISSGPSINVAMATTSGFLQAVFVAQHLRGVEWWGKVIPAVGTLLTIRARTKCAYAVYCTIPYHPGNAVAGELWPLRSFAAVTKHVEPRTTGILVKCVAEHSMYPKIRACAATGRRVTLW